jgi:hypothetical protein
MEWVMALWVVVVGAVVVLVIQRVRSETFPHGLAYCLVLAKCSVAAALAGLLSILA